MRIFESAEKTLSSPSWRRVNQDDIEFIMLILSMIRNDHELRTEQTISKDELVSRASDAHGRYVGYKWIILRAPEIYHS